MRLLHIDTSILGRKFCQLAGKKRVVIAISRAC